MKEYLGMFKNKRMNISEIKDKKGRYVIGNFVTEKSFRYQDFVYEKSVFSLKEIKILVKRKNWKQVSWKTIKELERKEIIEAL